MPKRGTQKVKGNVSGGQELAKDCSVWEEAISEQGKVAGDLFARQRKLRTLLGEACALAVFRNAEEHADTKAVRRCKIGRAWLSRVKDGKLKMQMQTCREHVHEAENVSIDSLACVSVLFKTLVGETTAKAHRLVEALDLRLDDGRFVKVRDLKRLLMQLQTPDDKGDEASEDEERMEIMSKKKRKKKGGAEIAEEEERKEEGEEEESIVDVERARLFAFANVDGLGASKEERFAEQIARRAAEIISKAT